MNVIQLALLATPELETLEYVEMLLAALYPRIPSPEIVSACGRYRARAISERVYLVLDDRHADHDGIPCHCYTTTQLLALSASWRRV